MYLEPYNKNKYNSDVVNIQRMLNAIRANFHHNWDYLTVDGIYGKQTANVVRQFQIYKGVSSQMTKDGPILGDTTIQYIKEEYQYVPRISSLSPYTQPYSEHQKTNPLDIAKKITDSIIGCISTFDEFLKREMSYVNSLRVSNPNALKQRFYSLATRMDPTMQNLKRHLTSYHSDGILKESFHNKNARRSRKNLVKELKNFDIISKIEKFLESKGISGKIKIGENKSKKIINIKGGHILAIWSYKDLIFDICKISEWGTEKWYADLKKHFYEILDGLIIGYASTVIAELIVGLAVTAVGVTISSGWIVVIIAIAALLISLLFSFLMSAADVSFSQMAIEGYGEIISLIRI